MNSLVLAGILSFIGSLIHIGVIFGGPAWYRFFGAGERMAKLAEAKSIKPTLITIAIALVLLYGLSMPGREQVLSREYLF